MNVYRHLSLSPGMALAAQVLPRGLMSPTSLFVSTLPLRVRFSLVVAPIVAGVIGALWWLSLRIGDPQGATTFWFVLSGILLATLLVDQAARRLVFGRLAQMREAMQRAASGQLNARAPVDGLDEIGVIARGLNDILQGLERPQGVVRRASRGGHRRVSAEECGDRRQSSRDGLIERGARPSRPVGGVGTGSSKYGPSDWNPFEFDLHTCAAPHPIDAIEKRTRSIG